jgi:hypothetical protein
VFTVATPFAQKFISASLGKPSAKVGILNVVPATATRVLQLHIFSRVKEFVDIAIFTHFRN